MDHQSVELYVVNRGTQGPLSWVLDFLVFKGKDEIHIGFKTLAEHAFAEVSSYITKFPSIVFSGQSQGSAVALIESVYAIERLSCSSVRAVLNSTPPSGGSAFARRVNSHIASGRLAVRMYIEPEDPVASKHLREAHSIFRNGVDPDAEMYLMTDINKHDVGPLRLLNHSPAQQNASFSLWLQQPVDEMMIQNDVTRRVKRTPPFKPSVEDIMLLSLLTELIIN